MLIDNNGDDLLRCVWVLGMVLSDIMKDALKLQTLRGLHRKGLAEKEVTRVREALMDLDASLDRMKKEFGLIPSAYMTGDIFHKSADGILEKILHT
ncbi:MAG: hypothetical protein A2Y60_04085 [Chloroflexi bacterium RBG_13_54_9]|nr:MAG: hypothetical protein A2Y60_04085 [Chloroflexi bacterium RBG_13_54_9]